MLNPHRRPPVAGGARQDRHPPLTCGSSL